MGYTLEQPRVVAQLHETGVRMYPNTSVIEWTNGVLRIERSDTGAEQKPIHAGCLINVSARLPRSELRDEIGEFEDLGPCIHSIGDCIAPGTIQAAVFSGHRMARSLLGDAPAIPKRERPLILI